MFGSENHSYSVSDTYKAQLGEFPHVAGTLKYFDYEN